MLVTLRSTRLSFCRWVVPGMGIRVFIVMFPPVLSIPAYLHNPAKLCTSTIMAAGFFREKSNGTLFTWREILNRIRNFGFLGGRPMHNFDYFNERF